MTALIISNKNGTIYHDRAVFLFHQFIKTASL